jgi:hypothetical protein
MQDIELANVGQQAFRLLRVKMRRTRIEHILSALPLLATEERTFGIGSSVPLAAQCSAANRRSDSGCIRTPWFVNLSGQAAAAPARNAMKSRLFI